MERIDILTKSAIAGTGGAISFMFGGFSALLNILALLVIADYLTGVVAAFYEGKLRSKVGFRGIAKKFFIFAIVFVAHQIDQAIGDNHLVRDATIFFYIANEVVSILENAGRVGVPVPSVLKKGIELLRDKSEEVKK